MWWLAIRRPISLSPASREQVTIPLFIASLTRACSTLGMPFRQASSIGVLLLELSGETKASAAPIVTLQASEGTLTAILLDGLMPSRPRD